MRARLTKFGAALAALAALAVGGSSLAAAGQKAAPPTTPPASQSQPADTDTLQQGDQTGSDTAETQSEQAGSESESSDGPGGYADTNPNADTEQQGEH